MLDFHIDSFVLYQSNPNLILIKLKFDLVLMLKPPCSNFIVSLALKQARLLLLSKSWGEAVILIFARDGAADVTLLSYVGEE